MPIYEYHCPECGNTFEHLARRLAEPAPVCPNCGAKKVEKLLSAFSPAVGSGSKAKEGPPCANGGRCAGGSCPYA